MVPEGWKIAPASEYGEINAGRQRSPKFIEGIEYPYLRVANVFDGYIDSSDLLRMNFNASEFEKYRLKYGDILLNEGQSIGLVGRSAMYTGLPENCCFQNTLVRFRPGENVDKGYALQRFRLCLYDGTFQSIAKKTTSIAHLGVSRFASLELAWPPLPEQNKIAQILSSWDKAIATTEQLLSNSQQQKKSLMQQLITGKKRFPGFEGEWKDEHLTSVAKVIVSPVDKKTIEGEKPVRLCNYTDVYYNGCITKKLDFMLATATEREISKFTLKMGDVIITKDSETPGDIAVPAFVSEDLGGVVCGYHLAILRPLEGKVDGEFLSHLLSMPKTRYYFFTLANGVTRFGLPVGGIEKAHFNLPPIDEQQKIASVLSGVDREIETLQQGLDNLKQEKKALMQQLLTGKRRVKV